MAKNTKKTSINYGKPITQFFTRTPRVSISTPQGEPPASVTKSTAVVPVEETHKAEPMAGPSKSQDKLKPLATYATTTLVSSSPIGSSRGELSERDDHSDAFFTAPDSSPMSRKRTRSPSPDSSSLTSSSKLLASPGMFMGTKSLAVSSKSGSLIFKKKPRLTSPSIIAGPEIVVVPSSQSDEEDLSSLRKLHTISDDSSDDVKPLEKAEGISNASVSLPPSPLPSEEMSSPSANRRPSMPPTPVALDPTTKAANMIAEIKKRAYARVSSSPDEVPLVCEEVLDSLSSSDEDELPMLKHIKLSSLQKPITSAVATRHSTRQMLKPRSPSPSLRSRTRASSSRVSPTSNTAKKPVIKANTQVPFESLLKERRTAVRKGVDEKALQRAEETAQKIANEVVEDVKPEEDADEPESWDIDDPVDNPLTFIEKLGIGHGDKSGVKVDLGEDLQKTLFGASKEKGAYDILKHDQALQVHDKSVAKRSGISFWLPSTNTVDAMSVDDHISRPPTTGSPILKMLNTCLQRQDTTRAAKLLVSNFMLAVNPLEQEATATYLYDLVFSNLQYPESLRKAAFQALQQFWATSTSNNLTFFHTLRSIQYLGADSAILSSQGWELQVTAPINVDKLTRERAIQRLLALVTNIQAQDVVDVIVLLTLVAMDLTSTPEVLRDITRVIDELGQRLSPDSSLQFSLCKKLIKAGAPFSAADKDRLVSLLSSGSAAIRQVASFVAYAFLTDNYDLQPKIYSDVPPLDDLVDQLTNNSKSETAKFSVHSTTDYVDLGLHVNILAIAISNLRGYAAHERRTQVSTRQGEKLQTPLQVLHGALEHLHSSIADTRATHLERSRTKGVIKGLSMNVYYQRDFWLKHNTYQKPKTLAQYFTKK